MRWVSETLDQSTKKGKGNHCFSLAVFFDDPWWAEKVRCIWTLATDEGVAAPQIEQIVASLVAEGANLTQVAEAWSLATSRLPRWKSAVRPGAVAPAVQALFQHCEKQVASLTGSEHGLPADLWMKAGQELRSRCQWLHDFVDCSALLSKLDPVMNSMTNVAAFAAGMQQVRDYASLDSQDERDSALADIPESFARHRGGITNPDDIAPVEALLADLADVHQVSPVAAAAGHSLATALPPPKENAPGWRLPGHWRATMHAVQFIRHHEKIRELSGSADDDPDTIFGECLASLQAWKHELVAASGASGCTASSTPLHPRSFLKDVLGKETEHLNVAVEEVEKWVNKRVQKQSQSKRLAVTKALEKLEDIAGGKSGGHSWKENLNDTSSYDDVQREAAYHFAVKEDETTTKPLHEVLDTIFLELEAAKKSLRIIHEDLAEARVSGSGLPEVLPVSFTRRIELAEKRAQITHTESFLFEIIGSSGSGKGLAIQARMQSMTDMKMESTVLQPAIWRKAQLLSAQRRRPTDVEMPMLIKKPKV